MTVFLKYFFYLYTFMAFIFVLQVVRTSVLPLTQNLQGKVAELDSFDKFLVLAYQLYRNTIQDNKCKLSSNLCKLLALH